MVRNQKGFTIIELVVVIVILGILAAVAFPKFQDMSTDAKTAVLNGAKAAVQSAAVISYAKNQGSPASLTTIMSNVQMDPAITQTGACAGVILTYNPGGVALPSFSITDYCN